METFVTLTWLAKEARIYLERVRPKWHLPTRIFMYESCGTARLPYDSRRNWFDHTVDAGPWMFGEVDDATQWLRARIDEQLSKEQ